MKTDFISPIHAIAISLGAMIGWGAFVMPGDLFLNKTNFIGSLFAFGLGTALIALVARSYVRLMDQTHGLSGNAVAWVWHYVGHKHALIYSVSILMGYLAIVALNASAIALLLRNLLPNGQLVYLYRINDWDVYLSELLISLLALFLFAVVNLKGLKAGASVQLVISLMMVMAIVLLSTMSVLSDVNTHHMPNLVMEVARLNDLSWLAVLAVVPWAYVGFETIPYIAKNIQNSQKMTKRIVYLSLISGFFCYILVNYFTAVNFDFDYHAIANSAWATGEGVKHRIGSVGMLILALAMTGAILSGINGFMLSVIKLIESMNDVGFVPKFAQSWFGDSSLQSSAHTKKLVGAIFVVCACISLLGRNHLLTLVHVASFGIALGFIYIVWADIRLQRQKQAPASLLSYLALLASFLFVFLIF